MAAICLAPAYAAAETTAPAQAAASGSLSDIEVQGTRNSRNEAGHDKVYELDMSTVYRDRKQLDDFRGTSPADIYQGVVGVFSGDARNSGALDTNIRGVQGQERVPVIIDGTKQAITVWRGYNGANNRNYIDPLLISGMSIEKGPSLTRGVQGSVGGAVVINTLNVDDILKPGEKWGIDISGDIASNTTKHRAYNVNDYVGKNWQDLPRDLFPAQPPSPWNPIEVPWFDTNHQDYLTWQKPKSKGGGLQGQDQTYRLAAAAKTDHFDILAAYVYRNRGNYFSGNKGKDKYHHNLDVMDPEKSGYSSGRYATDYMAAMYKPNTEVFNTSEESKSWLFKATWKPTDKQSLQFGYRRTESEFGDIMPSRIAHYSMYGTWNTSGKERLPQWPLSNVKLNAYNLEYKWQPENRWIDLSANLWTTRADSEFNSTGGYPLQPLSNLQMLSAMAMEAANLGNYDKLVKANFCSTPGPACLDQVMPLLDKAQQEFIAGTIKFPMYSTSQLFTDNTRWGLTASNKMILNDKLNLTVGGSYQYERLSSDSAWLDDPIQRSIRLWTNFGYFAWPRAGKRQEWEGNVRFDWRPTSQLDVIAGLRYNRYSSEDTLLAERREKRDFSFADQKYINGLNATDDRAWQLPQKAKAHGWSPQASVSYRFNDDYSRVYLRYAQQLRMPTLFETTTGFSMFVSNTSPVKPERGINIELGYIHDLRQWLPRANHADIKLAYYNNTIKDVIDRGDAGKKSLHVTNFDRQKTAGLELQSRYDNGRFFVDFSLGYILKNEVCDADESQRASIAYNRNIPECVQNGFSSGYLSNMAPPKLTADLLLGGRFINEKLELGTRLHYHSRKINPNDFENNYGPYFTNKEKGEVNPAWYGTNVALNWQPVTTIDAYLTYKLGKNVTATVAGTNLTNRYYLDPLARTAIPAPGRALRVGVKAKF